MQKFVGKCLILFFFLVTVFVSTRVLCVYVNLEPPIHWFASIEYLYRFMTCLENYFFHVVNDNKLFSVLLHCALNCLNVKKSKTNELGVLNSVPYVFNYCVSVVINLGLEGGGHELSGYHSGSYLSSSSVSMLLGPLKGFKMV